MDVDNDKPIEEESSKKKKTNFYILRYFKMKYNGECKSK